MWTVINKMHSIFYIYLSSTFYRPTNVHLCIIDAKVSANEEQKISFQSAVNIS